MAIQREVVVKVSLEAQNKLSPELARAKADAEAAAGAVRKIGQSQAKPTFNLLPAEGERQVVPGMPKPTFGLLPVEGNRPSVPVPDTNGAYLKLASDIADAESELRKLINTQGMSQDQMQVWGFQQEGASDKQLSNLKALQQANQKVNEKLTLGDDIARAEVETRKLVATQGMSRQEIKLWEFQQRGATDRQLANLKKLQSAQLAGNPEVTMDEYRMASRLARVHTIVGLGTAALAGAGAGGQVGTLLGNTLGGAAAGAATGLPFGIAIGAAVGGVTAIFKIIQEGADEAIKAVQKFRDDAEKAATAGFGADAAVRRARRGDVVTEEDLTRAAPGVAASIAAIPAADRDRLGSTILVREAERASRELRDMEARPRRAEGELAGSWWSRTLAPGTIAPTTTEGELAHARTEAYTLAAAAARGIRPDDRPTTSSTDAAGLRASMMESAGGRVDAATESAATLARIEAFLTGATPRILRAGEPLPV